MSFFLLFCFVSRPININKSTTTKTSIKNITSEMDLPGLEETFTTVKTPETSLNDSVETSDFSPPTTSTSVSNIVDNIETTEISSKDHQTTTSSINLTSVLSTPSNNTIKNDGESDDNVSIKLDTFNSGDDDGLSSTPSPPPPLSSTTSTPSSTVNVIEVTTNQYEVEGFRVPFTNNVTSLNGTRESKKLNITSDYDELLPVTTIKPEVVESRCNDEEFECLTSGECVPLDDVCNQIMDCSDKSDEFGCKCVDYLYREENHRHKICDGVIDCQDQSDELNCPKCNESESFVCTGRANQCISNARVCDGEEDCPNGDDEQGCISLAEPSNPNKLGVTYNQRGILLIRHHGVWAPLCFDNYEIELNGLAPNQSMGAGRGGSGPPLAIEDMGQAVCRANAFDTLKSIDIETLPDEWRDKAKLFFSINNTLTDSRPKQPSSAMWSVLFQKSDCLGKKVARIECTNFGKFISFLTFSLQLFL